MVESSASEHELLTLRARLAELEARLAGLAGAEERALGARAQSQALLDNIPHMAWMKDTQGVFLAVNEAFARACQRPACEILGKTDRDIWPLEHAERYMRDDQRVIENERPFFVEEQIAEGGGVAWFETFKSPIRDQRGVVMGTVGLARDITDKKLAEEERLRLERRMQETQKLESLGVLAGGIAHDFNNLLVGVLANADLALGELANLPSLEAARERIRDVRRAALHAAELTNQMLAYSGRGRFDVRPVSLTAIVGDMSQLLGASVSKKARLTYDLDRELPAVQADVTQLRQVIMNLVVNASDALEERVGSIRVSTGVQEIGDVVPDLYGPGRLAPGVYAFVEVADTGCGMSEETRAQLFEPFFSTKFVGRGLGLAAVQGIVRGHAGGITLRTQVGVGTSMRLLLPSSAAALVAPAPPLDEAREWMGAGLALLVDDDARVRTVTEHLLRSIGFDVCEFGTGREAIREVERRGAEVRVVVLDVTMPDMNGEQVLRELRRLRPALPVLLCSGYSPEELSQRFAPEDMAVFLQKPYPFEALRAQLRNLLER
jgi:two-component system cell cycle sensor histidine kinase/response regulator CckA